MCTSKPSTVRVKSIDDEQFDLVKRLMGANPNDGVIGLRISPEGEIMIGKASKDFEDDPYGTPLRRLKSITPAVIAVYEGSNVITITINGISITMTVGG
jgi:hypothetical protein